MVRRSKRLSSLNQTGEEPQPVRTEETRTDAEVENWVSFETGPWACRIPGPSHFNMAVPGSVTIGYINVGDFILVTIF